MTHALTVCTMLTLSGCAAAALAPTDWPPHAAMPAAPVSSDLARFMREGVNVPFSFAVLEHDGAQRPLRAHGAARVLQVAARDLVHWEDLPASSPEGRAVFQAYARDLEQQVGQLEAATRHGDIAETGVRLAAIRRTCESCHHFFRPPSVTP
jgi:hypothetical protein